MLERSERDTEINDTAARCTKQKCVASVNIEASHKGDATEVRDYFMEDFKCIEESRNPEFSKSGRDLRCSRFFACI